MANEVEILGSENLALGFGDVDIGEILPETFTHDPTADLEYIKDRNANDGVALISNRGKRYTAEGYLYANVNPPAKGDTVQIGGVKYLVESCPVRRTAKTARMTITVYKPNATTWETPSSGSGTNSGTSNP